MKSIDKEKIKFIEILLKKGFSYRQIRQETGINISKLSQIKQKLRNKEDKNYPIAKNGRPRKIDSRGERKLVRLIVSGKCDTAAAIKNEVKKDRTPPAVS